MTREAIEAEQAHGSSDDSPTPTIMPQHVEAPPVRSCVVIAGMHRSGTSSICGTLAQLGLQRPLRELPPQLDNPTGFFEPKVIVELHERLLASLGSEWFSWKPLPDGWLQRETTQEFGRQLKAAFAEDYVIPGTPFVKDPRICGILDLWKQILHEMNLRTLVLIPFRDPLEVAESLKARNGFDVQQSMLVWLRHVLDAELGSRGIDRLFVEYGPHLPILPRLRDVLRERSIPVLEAASGLGFSDITLRHHQMSILQTAEDDASKLWFRDAFKALKMLADDPNDSGAIDRLDNIQQTFRIAASCFGLL